MSNTFFISRKVSTVKRTITFVFLVISLLLPSVTPAFAQEPENPVHSKPTTTETPQKVTEDTPTQSKEDIPAEEESQKREEPAKDTENNTEKEKSKSEDAPPSDSLTTAGGGERSSAKFEIPTQPKASVDQSTGALIYQYPIKLPEGRAGMTPELTLKYNSRLSTKPDSIAGLGWELSIPYIMRERAPGNQDLYAKAYFTSSLSGNLIATTDTASSQYTTYRSETDNGDYLKYTYSADNSWTMTGKDGKTYSFGSSAASRQDNPSDSAKVYKWMISKIADAHGNEIQYSYIKDSGQIYPSQIVYTYHALSAAVHTVDFAYTTPINYGSTVYNSAFPVTTYKLLNTITVTTTIDSQTSAHTYTLSYDNAQFIKQKLLASIQQTHSLYTYELNQAFNDTTTFSYSTKAAGWEQGTHSLGEYLPYHDNSIFKDVYTADFDLNGYPDVLVSTHVNRIQYNYIMLNSGTNFTESGASWSLPSEDIGEKHAIVDVNGDRLPDLHPRSYSSTETHALYINTGSGFSSDTSGTWEIGNYVPEAYGCGPNVGDKNSFDTNTFLYDINNDGKNDILYFGGSADFRVYLNNGNGFTVSSAYTFTPAYGSSFTINTVCTQDLNADGYQTLMDINGDGLADYYNQKHGTYLNIGSGFAYSSTYAIDIAVMGRSGFADINGDNLVDYISFKFYSGTNKCARVLLNNGAGFSQINPTNFPTNCNNSGVWNPDELKYTDTNGARYGSLVDITADGFPDIVGAATTGESGKVRAINDSRNAWTANPNSGDQWTHIVNPSYGVFFDLNVDGVPDFITATTSWDGSSAMATSKVYTGKASVPNRLTQITSPLGAQTAIEYTTAPTNNDDTDPSPMPVVKKVTIQNIGPGQPAMVTQYTYINGVYVIDLTTGQKRFAGFHKVTATESGSDLSALRVTENYFHQGNGSDAATSEPPDTSLALIGKPYYTIIKHPTGTPKKETWNKYETHTLVTEPITNRLSKFVYHTETAVKTTDSVATISTAEVYSYDTTIGERVELRQLGFVTIDNDGAYTDVAGDTRYEFTEYANNSDNSVIKPKRVDIRTSSSSSDTIARTDYFYDNQSQGIIGTLGNLTKETKWISGAGTTTANIVYTYDSFGNVLTITNPRSAVTTYTYDSSKSLVASETNHLNHTISYEYMTGLLKKVTDPNGRIITYSYSSIGLLYRTIEANTAGNRHWTQYLENAPNGTWAILSTDLPAGSNYPDYTWQSLDNLARPVRFIRRHTNHTDGTSTGWYLKEVSSYDALGRQITASAPYGTPHTSDWHYLLPVSLPSNLITTTSYDVFDRPTSITNALGTTSHSYEGTETTTTDANSNQKKFKTDAYGNLIQVKEYDGSNVYTTNYTYDARNLLTGITDALGNVRGFTYNDVGWLTNSEDLHAPGDTSFGSTSWTYDLNGNAIVETQPNGVTVTRAYDMLDRPTSIDGSSTVAADYTLAYDNCTYGKGRVCTVSGTLPNSVTLNKSYIYGKSGVPTSVTLTTLGNSYTTSYQYNLSDQIKQTNYPNGTVVRTAFGDWGKPSTIYTTLPGSSETTYATVTYHHTEQPETVTITSSLTTSHTYDSTKLYRKINTIAAKGGATIQSYAYTYDNVNNITQIVEPNLTKTYNYDDLNRLTQAVYAPSGGTPTTYSYSYNAIGNITFANGNSYIYGGAGKINPHAVTSVGANNYTYDDNGNIATAPNKVFTYNWQNQPESIFVGGSATINSAYDEAGIRFLYQTPNTIEIQAENNYLVRNGTPEINISLGNIPLGLISNGAVYSSIPDHLGTPIKQVNSNGTIVESTSYEPFGAVSAHIGTVDIKKGYTGHDEDTDTGLVYAKARYYDPIIGRFMSQDPVYLLTGNNEELENKTKSKLKYYLSSPQNLNSYSYVKNNPLVAVDPRGEWIQYIIGEKNAVKVGDWANNLYNNNSVARYAMDHPYQAGAIAGVAGGAVVAGSVVAGGGAITCGVLCGSGSAIIGASAPVVQQVQKNQQQIIAAGNRTLQLGDHALLRMSERGITQQQVANIAQKGQSFDYLHKGELKVGYYDPVSKVLVATMKSTGNITTVINNVSQNYVNTLIQTVKK